MRHGITRHTSVKPCVLEQCGDWRRFDGTRAGRRMRDAGSVKISDAGCSVILSQRPDSGPACGGPIEGRGLGGGGGVNRLGSRCKIFHQTASHVSLHLPPRSRSWLEGAGVLLWFGFRSAKSASTGNRPRATCLEGRYSSH